MSGWMLLSETKLKRVNKFISFKDCIKPIIHDSFEDFINFLWKQNWSILWTISFFSFLWIGILVLVFKMFGNMPDESDRFKRGASWLDISLF